MSPEKKKRGLSAFLSPEQDKKKNRFFNSLGIKIIRSERESQGALSSRYRSPDKTTSHQSRPAKCGVFVVGRSETVSVW